MMIFFWEDVKFRHVIYNCLEILRSSYSMHIECVARCLEKENGAVVKGRRYVRSWCFSIVVICYIKRKFHGTMIISVGKTYV